ncbi:MAG: APC family permease [Rhizomicrobium sp.]
MSLADEPVAASLEQFGYKQELKRALTLRDLLIYGLVLIVPAAPFGVYGVVFNAAHGMVPLIYLVGLVAMLFTAMSYQALSEAFPVAGSAYAFAGRGIAPEAGFIAGWAILLDYIIVPTLCYVVAAIAFAALVPEIPRPVWIVVMLGFATAVNYFGVDFTARINFVLLGLQSIVLAILVGFCFWGVQHHIGGAHWSLLPFYNPKELTPHLVFGALSLAVLSFLGFDAISTLSEEVVGGKKTVGIATLLSLCMCAFLFMAQTYMVSLFALGQTSFPPGPHTDGALYDISNMLGGPWLKFATAIPGAALSSLACALAAQGATARLIYGMARDRKLPAPLAAVHPTTKVPANALFLVSAVTLVCGVFMADKLELLTSIVSFGALTGFLLVHAAVISHFVVRGKSRNLLRYLVAPAIGFVIIAYVLLNTDIDAKIVGLSWMVLGVGVLIWFRLTGRAATLPAE